MADASPSPDPSALPDAVPACRVVLVLGPRPAGDAPIAPGLALAGTVALRLPDDGGGAGAPHPLRDLGARLLAAVGAVAEDWEPVPDAWLGTPEAAGFAAEARALLDSAFGGGPRAATEDTRAARPAPAWIGTLRDRGAGPVAVLALPGSPDAGPDAEPDAGAGLAAELRRSLEAAMTEAGEARLRADALSRRLARAEGELARRAEETAAVTSLLLDAERRAFRPVARLREAGSLAARAASGLASGLASRLREGRLPSPFATRRRIEELRRSGEFDAGWYLRANLDVALSGMDPLRHYVLHGEREGRRPNGGPIGIDPPAGPG